jgi:hypothetical protein
LRHQGRLPFQAAVPEYGQGAYDGGVGFRSRIALLCLTALLLAAIVREAVSEAAAPGGRGVVFSVFENLPPNGACPGLYAVDERTREISWLGGWDAQRQDSALYPAFTDAGTFSYAQIVDPSANLASVDVYAGSRIVGRANIYANWVWSPRREELAYAAVTADRKRLELLLGSVRGGKRVLAASTIGGISWLPDGSGLVYMRRSGEDMVITFVRRDGRGRRDLARNAAAPRVSPDGKRVAFLRQVAETSVTNALWVVPTAGGKPQRVLKPTANEAPKIGAWLSSRELLVQRGRDSDVMFNAGDTVTRLDVVSGKQRPFLSDAFVLSLSPDRSRVLFVRPHSSAGETYYSIRTVRRDGRGQLLLAVTDEEDLNVGSQPAWKPASAPVGWVGDPPPPAFKTEDCVKRVTSLRDRTP